MKILFLSMHPAPYRDPLLAYLQEIYAEQFDILVFYPNQTTHKEWELDKETYRYIVPGKPVRVLGRDFHSDIFKHLKRGEYSLVFISGYMPWTSFAAYIWCKMHGVKVIYMADTTPEQYGSKRLTFLNRLLGKYADALWVPGTAARLLWEEQGVSAQKIFEGAYTLDWDAIQTQTSRIPASQFPPVLQTLLAKCKNKISYLFIGHFIAQRNGLNLVKAFAKLVARQQDVILVIIGKGPEYGKIRRYIEENRLEPYVCLVEGLPFGAIHPLYLNCDIYVHPGREPYSVSLQEAAFAGMRLVSTRQVGAALDVLAEGKNGLFVPANDVARLYEGLVEIQKYPVCRTFGRELTCQRGLAFAKSQIRKAIDSVLSRH